MKRGVLEMMLFVSVFTLDTRPSSVGRMNLYPKLWSISFDTSSTGGDWAILAGRFFSASPTFEIATKASVATKEI